MRALIDALCPWKANASPDKRKRASAPRTNFVFIRTLGEISRTVYYTQNRRNPLGRGSPPCSRSCASRRSFPPCCPGAENTGSFSTRRGAPPPPPPPAPPTAARGPPAVRVPPSTRGVREKAALVSLVDRVARGELPEIRQVRATYGEAERRSEVAAHPGVFVSEAQTFTLLTAQAVAGNESGLAMGYESGGGTVGWEFLEEFVPEALARKAASRAGRPPPAREVEGGRMGGVISGGAGG